MIISKVDDPRLRYVLTAVTEQIRAAPAWLDLLVLLNALDATQLDLMAVGLHIPTTAATAKLVKHIETGFYTLLLGMLRKTCGRSNDVELLEVWACWMVGTFFTLPGVIGPAPIWASVRPLPGTPTLVLQRDRQLLLELNLTWPGLSEDDNHALRTTLYELFITLIHARPAGVVGVA